jgi:hypothetical protein
MMDTMDTMTMMARIRSKNWAEGKKVHVQLALHVKLMPKGRIIWSRKILALKQSRARHQRRLLPSLSSPQRLDNIFSMMLTQIPTKKFVMLPRQSQRMSLRQTVRKAKMNEPSETSSGQDSYSVSRLEIHNFHKYTKPHALGQKTYMILLCL